jgi:hypothetical protein
VSAQSASASAGGQSGRSESANSYGQNDRSQTFFSYPSFENDELLAIEGRKSSWAAFASRPIPADSKHVANANVPILGDPNRLTKSFKLQSFLLPNQMIIHDDTEPNASPQR